MNFKEWFEQNPLGDFLSDSQMRNMRTAWDAAIEQAEIIVADKYDELEPWLEPGEISKITKEI
jgi:hypothetical protein